MIRGICQMIGKEGSRIGRENKQSRHAIRDGISQKSGHIDPNRIPFGRVLEFCNAEMKV